MNAHDTQGHQATATAVAALGGELCRMCERNWATVCTTVTDDPRGVRRLRLAHVCKGCVVRYGIGDVVVNL